MVLLFLFPWAPEALISPSPLQFFPTTIFQISTTSAGPSPHLSCLSLLSEIWFGPKSLFPYLDHLSSIGLYEVIALGIVGVHDLKESIDGRRYYEPKEWSPNVRNFSLLDILLEGWGGSSSMLPGLCLGDGQNCCAEKFQQHLPRILQIPGYFNLVLLSLF